MLVIRPMTREDVPAVSAVDRLCFMPPWARDTFAAECSSPVACYRVAVLRGDIVGFIGSQMILDEAHIATFGVHPDARDQGIGERLLADLLREAVRRDCRRITLEVRESNAAAVHLYRKYGFSPVSRRSRYYADNDEDAIVMWIEDTARHSFRALLAERLGKLDQG